jgi:hypothetical protein
MGATEVIATDRVITASQENSEKDQNISAEVQPYAEIDPKEERAFV